MFVQLGNDAIVLISLFEYFHSSLGDSSNFNTSGCLSTVRNFGAQSAQILEVDFMWFNTFGCECI